MLSDSFLILFSLFGHYSHSQQTEDLIGDWKIIKIELAKNVEGDEIKMLETLKPIFLKSTFRFKQNNLCSCDSPREDLVIKDAIWKFDSKKKYINITERSAKKNPGELMGITVEAKNDAYLFFMEETPIILTVKKK